jgi:hypothetical protein
VITGCTLGVGGPTIATLEVVPHVLSTKLKLYVNLSVYAIVMLQVATVFSMDMKLTA